MDKDDKNRSYLMSWSGGKDSCLALYEALRLGYRVSRLMNFISTDPKRVRFHGTNPGLIQLQGEALGIPVHQPETTWDGYERDFKAAVGGMVPLGIKGMVFGDIYLQEHLDWVQRVCSEIGIEAVEPLWGRDTGELYSSFVEAGFEAVIIGAKAELIESHWLGKKLDRAFADYTKARGIDPCGEKGEYHTLVTAGPIFRRRIAIGQSELQSRDGYWLLDIKKYGLE